LTGNTRFDRLAVSMFIGFLVCFFIYKGITHNRILNSPNHVYGVMKPFWLSDGFLQKIHNDGYLKLEYYYDGKGPIDTDNLLGDKSAFSYGITAGAIYLTFILLFCFLTASFLSLWLHFEIANKSETRSSKKMSD
jgi:hypothetical protein